MIPPPFPWPSRRPALPGLLVALLWLVAAAPAPTPAPVPAPAGGPLQDASRIVAIVNGDVISRADVDNRRRLFALSTGMPSSPDVLDRLTPQVTRQADRRAAAAAGGAAAARDRA